MKEESLIGHASELVRIIRKSPQPADRLTQEFLRSKKYIGARDRRYISELTFRVQRKLGWAVNYAKAKGLEDITQAAVDLEHDDSFADILASLPEHEQVNTQPWLLEETKRRWDDAADVWRAMMEPAPLCLRVNLMRVTREKILGVLEQEGIDAEPGKHSPAAIVINKRVNLTQHDLMKEGFVEVQDEGSQLIGYACEVEEGMVVLDACAGAGGKTVQLADIMNGTGTVYAQDIEWKRLKEVSKRAHKSGVQNVKVELLHRGTKQRNRSTTHYDVVLVDAPCSGMGTIRRLPMVKWRYNEQQLERQVRKQLMLLNANAPLVVEGGSLVYSTCSILPSENEDVVQRFLTDNPEFTLDVERQVDPHHDGTDGLYWARMKRG